MQTNQRPPHPVVSELNIKRSKRVKSTKLFQIVPSDKRSILPLPPFSPLNRSFPFLKRSTESKAPSHDIRSISLIQEKHLLVRGESPHVGRDDSLCRVAELADVDHGLEAEGAGEGGGRVGGGGGVDLGDGGLQGGDGGLEVADGADLGVLAGGEDVLVDHVDHAEGLHLDGAGVVVVEDVLAGLALLGLEDAHLGEEGDVLGVDHAVVGFDG
mmetsp:Transcript_25360/g.47652  ORF Transcript_25360/g.47652 Transcript_25360/m.47652 type:complete len:213 (+) Transcript_25360:70-708(+)